MSMLIKCSNKLLSKKYIIIKSIGSGSFGEVYIAETSDGSRVAVKVEDRLKNPLPKIINEYKIYQQLRRNGYRYGIPRIYEFFQTPDYNLMVMELLGQNLENLFVIYNQKFKLSTTLLLGINIIRLLQNLHSINHIHRDIKPSNFLIGNKHKDRIYLMDLGLAKKYIHKKRHIKYRTNKSLIGTARYASINMHKGIEPTRRDELESVGYMLVYFLKGSLPWQGLKKIKGRKPIDVIGDKKMNTHIDLLCSNIPYCFKEYILYCRKLMFEETPDYDYICNLFKNYSIKYNIELKYEWC